MAKGYNKHTLFEHVPGRVGGHVATHGYRMRSDRGRVGGKPVFRTKWGAFLTGRLPGVEVYKGYPVLRKVGLFIPFTHSRSAKRYAVIFSEDDTRNRLRRGAYRACSAKKSSGNRVSGSAAIECVAGIRPLDTAARTG